MPKFLKPWMGWVSLFVVLLIGAVHLSARAGNQRAAPEAARLLATQGSFLSVEKDIGSLSRDMASGSVALVGEATNLYLVERTDGEKYFVFKSAAISSSIGSWVEAGGELYALKQRINTTLSPSGRIAQGVLGVLFAGPVLTVMLLGGLFFVLGTRMGMFGSGTAFVKVVKPELRFRDVIGVREAKRELSDLTAALSNRAAYKRVGATPPRGVLLSGPPGTGKTLIAKALAGESGASFIAVDGSSFTDKFVGMGVQRVRQLFATARKNAPCVIFIDEIDGVGRRTQRDDSVAQENNRIINALLTEMDGFSVNEEVIVLAATNHPGNVDPALLREGRFDRKCMLSLPPLQDRKALFELYSRDLPVAKDVDFGLLARRTSGAAPATISAAVSAAARLAARDDATELRTSDFLAAISQQQLGTPSPETKMDDYERARTAYHEAGHAIIAHALRMATVEKVTILPHSRALGITVLSPEEDRHLHTQRELESQIQMLLGGRAAEITVFGAPSTGAVNDLERSSELAYRMVAEYGFSKTHGAFSIAAVAKDVPQAAMEAIEEARALLSTLESRSIALLAENRGVLEAMAKKLLEQETLEADEVAELLGAVAVARAERTPALAA